jgi:hypothetical protein
MTYPVYTQPTPNTPQVFEVMQQPQGSRGSVSFNDQSSHNSFHDYNSNVTKADEQSVMGQMESIGNDYAMYGNGTASIPSLQLPALSPPPMARQTVTTLAPIGSSSQFIPPHHPHTGHSRKPLPPPISTSSTSSNYKWPTSFRQYFRDTLISPDLDPSLSPRSQVQRRNCSLALISPTCMEVNNMIFSSRNPSSL